MNMTLLPWLTEHFPAGSSTRNLLHFLQSVGQGRLQAYDFGRAGNREKYGQGPFTHDVGMNSGSPLS